MKFFHTETPLVQGTVFSGKNINTRHFAKSNASVFTQVLLNFAIFTLHV